MMIKVFLYTIGLNFTLAICLSAIAFAMYLAHTDEDFMILLAVTGLGITLVFSHLRASIINQIIASEEVAEL